MKRFSQIAGFCLLISLSLLSCSKKSGGGGGPTPPPGEENLIIGIDPNPGTTTAQSLGSTYDFKVLVTSKMPASGVKVDVVCTKDSDQSVVSSQTLNSSFSPINATVSNLVSGVLCTVRVTVTSNSKPSNTATLTFKVSRK
jgi:hypothetical protein